MTLRYSITRPTPAQVLRRTRVRRSTLAGAGRRRGAAGAPLAARRYLAVLMPRFCSIVDITLPSGAKKVVVDLRPAAEVGDREQARPASGNSSAPATPSTTGR